MKIFTTKRLVLNGLVAGLYVALSLVVFPVASGAIQFRLSEGLTLLPLLLPETAFALFIGCMLSNLITGCIIADVILGSVITLVAGVFTAMVGRFIKTTWLKLSLGGVFPVLLNAFLLPVIWYYFYGQLEFVYMIQVAFLLVSQSVSVYAFGIPINLVLKKYLQKHSL